MLQVFRQRAEGIQQNIIELNKLYGTGKSGGSPGLSLSTKMFRKRKTIKDEIEALQMDNEQQYIDTNEQVMTLMETLNNNFIKVCEAIDLDKSFSKSQKLYEGIARSAQQQQNIIPSQEIEFDHDGNVLDQTQLQYSQHLNRSINLNKSINLNRSNRMNSSQRYNNLQNPNQIIKVQQQMYNQPMGDNYNNVVQTPLTKTRRAANLNRSRSSRSRSRSGRYLDADIEGQQNQNSTYGTRPTDFGDQMNTDQDLNFYNPRTQQFKMVQSPKPQSQSRYEFQDTCYYGVCQLKAVTQCFKCKKWICEDHKFKKGRKSTPNKLSKYGVDMNKEFDYVCVECSKKMPSRRKMNCNCKNFERFVYVMLCLTVVIAAFVLIILNLGLFTS